MHNFKMQMRVGIVTKIDTSSVQSELMHQPPGALEAHANPLHLAVRYGHRECVQAFLKRLFVRHSVDVDGRSSSVEAGSI